MDPKFLFLVVLAVISLIALLGKVAKYVGLIDEPNHRKLHESPTPLVGGLAIYIVTAALVISREPSVEVFWAVCATGLLVLVGALDDKFSLGFGLRLTVQLLATLMIVFGCSLWVTGLGPELSLLEFFPDWLGISVTVLAVLSLTNAFNFADGLDGLSSGHAIISLLTLIIFGFSGSDQFYKSEWLLTMIAAVSAFWLVNLSFTPLEKVFLGDAGSSLLGFVLAWVLIFYSREPNNVIHPVATLWCVSIPVFDFISVIVLRLYNRASVFYPDRSHLHHNISKFVAGDKRVLGVILFVSGIINVFGILVTCYISPLAGLITFMVMLILYIVASWRVTILVKLT